MGNIILRHVWPDATTTNSPVEPSAASVIPRPETLAAEFDRDAFNRRAEQEAARENKRRGIEAHLAYKYPPSRLLVWVRSLLLDGKRTFWVLLDDDDDSVAVGRAYLEKNIIEPVCAQGWAVDVVEKKWRSTNTDVPLDFHMQYGLSRALLVGVYDPKNPPPPKKGHRHRRAK